jgi:nucleoside-diphosphate-sugar epimerase
MRPKVCIIGGTGHISTSITKLLIDCNYEVYCINRGKSNIIHPKAKLIKGDRNDRNWFEKTLSQYDFDYAIDMICFSKEDAISSYNALKNVKHFIHISTVCTYGIKYNRFPITEDFEINPIDDYGKMKADADDFYMDCYKKYGFPVTIIKPSTIYGPIDGLARQISESTSWLNRIYAGKSIVECDGGVAIHQHLHVDDAANCFFYLINNEHTIGEIYNLANPEFINWHNYHKKIIELFNSKSKIYSVPYNLLKKCDIPDFDIFESIFAYNSYYSVSKLLKDIPDFNFGMSYDVGLRNVINLLLKENRICNHCNIDWEDDLIKNILN